MTLYVICRWGADLEVEIDSPSFERFGISMFIFSIVPSWVNTTMSFNG
jgi:hypothetical protein